ncbi:FAD binding domain-containing protein [Seiridium cupressi]
MSQVKPFRIIIAGGGLVGLSAAHIFQSLSDALSASRDVQFTILEAHNSITPFIGSLLLLYPSTFRVYDQVGLLSALEPVVDETKRTVSFRAEDGTVIYEDNGFSDALERRHGHGFRVCHRPAFAECLYQGLSEQSKGNILLGKRVVDVEVETDGVRVVCQDGTVVEGDVLIGADGVRSRVRSCMQRLRAGAQRSGASGNAGQADGEDGKSPYLAGFRLFFGNIPILPGLQTCTNWEGGHPGISTQILTGTKQAWWAVYEQIENPTRERVRYTEADKQKLLEKWGHLYMAPGYTMKEVLRYNSGKTGMINLEEGVIDTWTWNRIVLVGDAVRKVEPHAGLGFNQGMEDIVSIANKLHALLKRDTSTPDTEDLERIFEQYQAERLKVMPGIDRMCRRRARQVAWPNWKFRIYATWLLPYLPITKAGLMYIVGPIVRKAPVLDWGEEHNLPAHEIEYEHFGVKDDRHRGATVSKSSQGCILPLGTAAGLLAGLAAVGFRYYRQL